MAPAEPVVQEAPRAVSGPSVVEALHALGIDGRCRLSDHGDIVDSWEVGVHGADAVACERWLKARGFQEDRATDRRAARQHGPRRFVTYDDTTGRWLVVSLVANGPADSPDARASNDGAAVPPRGAVTFGGPGLSVALLAPDGGGKSTLAAALATDPILHARPIYMGTNPEGGDVALPTTRWLARQGGRPCGIAWRALRYGNRVAEQWYRLLLAAALRLQGRVVVFDRYLYDAVLAPSPSGLGRRIRRWLLTGPGSHPDLVILLDAPGEVLYRRKREHSPERLSRQRQKFRSLEARIPNLVVIDATQSAEAVRRRATALIWQAYRDRAAGTSGSWHV